MSNYTTDPKRPSCKMERDFTAPTFSARFVTSVRNWNMGANSAQRMQQTQSDTIQNGESKDENSAQIESDIDPDLEHLSDV
jgi:hypothetical protein